MPKLDPHPFEPHVSERHLCAHCLAHSSAPIHQVRLIPQTASFTVSTPLEPIGFYVFPGAPVKVSTQFCAKSEVLFEVKAGVDIWEALKAFRDAASRLISACEPFQFHVSSMVCQFCGCVDNFEPPSAHLEGCPWLLFVQSFAALTPKSEAKDETKA